MRTSSVVVGAIAGVALGLGGVLAADVATQPADAQGGTTPAEAAQEARAASTRASAAIRKANTLNNNLGKFFVADGVNIGASQPPGVITSDRGTGANGLPGSTIQNGAIAREKIANEAVNSEKIAPGGVTSGDLANDSVTGEKIVDGAVTKAKLAPDVAPAVTVRVGEPSGQGTNGGGPGCVDGVPGGSAGYQDAGGALIACGGGAGGASTRIVQCEAGEVVTGGGYRYASGKRHALVSASHPVPAEAGQTPTGWQIRVEAITFDSDNLTPVTPYAVCMRT